MMSMRYMLLALCASLTGVMALWAQQDYNGPTPPKADVPYLLHASNLVETEAVQATEEQKKNESTFWIEGDSSPARTPLAEPIFIIQADKIRPERIELYKFEVKRGRREITIKNNPGRNDARPLHLSVTKLSGNLYKVEASEQLENGEYSLSPSGTNEVFAFQVY